MTLDHHPRAAEFLALLEQRLKPKLVRHCKGVAETLLAIGHREGLDPLRCIEAGLLHDSCKHLKKKEYIEAAERWDIPVNDIARQKPMLLHGPIAAEEARAIHGLDDPDLYEAMYWHTTGKPGLNPLGLALYVADFCEPNREYPEAAEARDRLKADGLQEALVFVTAAKLAFVQAKDAVDPATAAFHQWVMDGMPR